MIRTIVTIAVACLVSSTAHAARVVLEGTVRNVQVHARTTIPGANVPATGFSFALSSSPATVPGVPYARFSVTTDSIADAETRQAIISTILFAYSAGKTVRVSYDDAGALIDNQSFGVYYVTVKD